MYWTTVLLAAMTFMIQGHAADVQIFDYSTAQIVTISDGLAKIQDGTFRLIHLIKLEEYATFLTETFNYIETRIPKNNVLYPILKQETRQTMDMLQTLKPTKPLRQKKSINALGSLWKCIAGSPDHEDLEIINRNLLRLNDNNNDQIVINKLFNERINNLTKITENISNSIRKDSSIFQEIIVNIQSKIRLVKEELINIKYAIQWAKSKMINSVLLNEEEIRIAIQKLSEENMPFGNAEEALEISDINVLSNEMTIVYMIKIPLTSHETFQEITLKPVITNENSVIKLDFKRILKFKEKIYGIEKECKDYIRIKICKNNQIIDLRNDTCITRIINGLNSTCTTTNGHHILRVEEIKLGVLLLNSFNGNIEINSEIRNLTGTHLINYHNATIKVNGKTYSNFEAIPLQAIPAILQSRPLTKFHEDLPSLESLTELHIKNTRKIGNLKLLTMTSGTLSISAIAVIICITMILYLPRKKNQLEITTKQTPRVPLPVENNLDAKQPTYISFSNLSYP